MASGESRKFLRAFVFICVLLPALALTGVLAAGQRWFGWVLITAAPVLLGAVAAAFVSWFNMFTGERTRLRLRGTLDPWPRRRRRTIEDETEQTGRQRAHRVRVARSRLRLGAGRRGGRRDPAGP